jgi:hypothetical protein
LSEPFTSLVTNSARVERRGRIYSQCYQEGSGVEKGVVGAEAPAISVFGSRPATAARPAVWKNDTARKRRSLSLSLVRVVLGRKAFVQVGYF